MVQADISEVLVVGGGLSGLMVTIGLERAGIDWKLLDAREALGGRIANDNNGDGIDLGGTWIWPKYQPFMKRLLNEMSIKTMPQPGDPLSERIVGGATEVINHLATNLPPNRILLNSPVSSCSYCAPDDISDSRYVCVQTSYGSKIYARRVIFAVPPVLLSKYVTFSPPLSEKKEVAMASCPTWMAGVTKIALMYPEKFWDAEYSNMTLGGDGPAFQVYDASTEDGKTKALSFFTQVSPVSPAYTSESFLAIQVSQQISNIWTYLGREDLASKATTYSGYHVKRWPLEPHIGDDVNASFVKPCPNPDSVLSEKEWDGVLRFAGSETDLAAPGLMEGAVASALRVLKELLPELKVSL